MADTLLEVRQGSPHKMRKALLSLLVIACGGIGGLGFLSGLTLVEGPDEVSAARRVDVVVGVLVGIAACGALHLLQFPRSRRKRVWSSIIVAIAVSAAVGGSLYAWQWSAMAQRKRYAKEAAEQAAREAGERESTQRASPHSEAPMGHYVSASSIPFTFIVRLETNGNYEVRAESPGPTGSQNGRWTWNTERQEFLLTPSTNSGDFPYEFRLLRADKRESDALQWMPSHGLGTPAGAIDCVKFKRRNSKPRSSRAEENYSDDLRLTNIDSILNDRRNWIDNPEGPPVRRR